MNLDRMREMFLAERELFADSYPDVATAGLRIKKFKRYDPRDCCMCDVEKGVVLFHPDVVDFLSDSQTLGLIRHELAHLCDGELSEAATDKLAERITGEPIFYDRYNIQNTKTGVRPRPRGLPK